MLSLGFEKRVFLTFDFLKATFTYRLFFCPFRFSFFQSCPCLTFAMSSSSVCRIFDSSKNDSKTFLISYLIFSLPVHCCCLHAEHCVSAGRLPCLFDCLILIQIACFNLWHQFRPLCPDRSGFCLSHLFSMTRKEEKKREGQTSSDALDCCQSTFVAAFAF